MSTLKRNMYIVGVIIALILALICALTLTKSSEEMLFNKSALDSFYLDSNVDFIVPGPSSEQLEAIRGDADNGIKEITPYYSFTTGVYVGKKSLSGVGYAFCDASELAFTPYNERRIISGVLPQSGEAVADYTFLRSNACKVGDVLSITYEGEKYEYTIVAECDSNLEFVNHSGTVAIVLREQEVKAFSSSLVYSGAFIRAEVYDRCLDFLKNEYKPLSRLKGRDSFATDEAYEQHVAQFNSYDWMKETTDFSANYNVRSVKYQNAEHTVFVYQVVESALIVIALFVFTAVMLGLKKHKNDMDIYMRKNRSTRRLLGSFAFNNIVIVILFCVVYAFLALWVSAVERSLFIAPYFIVWLLPMIVACIACAINIGVSAIIIKKRYKG